MKQMMGCGFLRILAQAPPTARFVTTSFLRPHPIYSQAWGYSSAGQRKQLITIASALKLRQTIGKQHINF